MSIYKFDNIYLKDNRLHYRRAHFPKSQPPIHVLKGGVSDFAN